MNNMDKQYICPKCGKGLEWGKKDMDGEIIYFWRCSWCGYRGEDIVTI